MLRQPSFPPKFAFSLTDTAFANRPCLLVSDAGTFGRIEVSVSALRSLGHSHCCDRAVLAWSHYLHMLGIYARCVVAKMVNVVARWNLFYEKVVGDAVGFECPAVSARTLEPSIAAWTGGRCPHPTFTGFAYLDLLPKPFCHISLGPPRHFFILEHDGREV